MIYRKALRTMDEYFTFELSGTTYVMPMATKLIFTPGWTRKHRDLSEGDYILTLLENLCGSGCDPRIEVSNEQREQGSAILDALDDAAWPDHKRVQSELASHLQVTAGE